MIWEDIACLLSPFGGSTDIDRACPDNALM